MLTDALVDFRSAFFSFIYLRSVEKPSSKLWKTSISVFSMKRNYKSLVFLGVRYYFTSKNLFLGRKRTEEKRYNFSVIVNNSPHSLKPCDMRSF